MCENGKVLLEQIPKAKPDIVIMDIRMPEMDGIEATKKISELYSDIKVIAFSADARDSHVTKILKAGAVAYLEKDAEIEEVRNAIYEVYDNGYYYNNVFTEDRLIALGISLPQAKDKIKLSPKELQVLEMICKDYSTTEIANVMNVDARTIEKHRERIRKKTDTHTPIGLLKYAVKHNLFKL